MLAKEVTAAAETSTVFAADGGGGGRGNSTEHNHADHYSPNAELASFLLEIEELTFVHAFGNGIEIESAGRKPNKSQTVMRNDLAALPFLIAGTNVKNV